MDIYIKKIFKLFNVEVDVDEYIVNILMYELIFF